MFVLLYNSYIHVSTFIQYTLGWGEGVRKKSTLCTLAKKQKIVDHSLHTAEYLGNMSCITCAFVTSCDEQLLNLVPDMNQ